MEDTTDSKPVSRQGVQVQVLSSAISRYGVIGKRMRLKISGILSVSVQVRLPVFRLYNILVLAGMSELADESDLGSDVERRVGSSPTTRSTLICDSESVGF